MRISAVQAVVLALALTASGARLSAAEAKASESSSDDVEALIARADALVGDGDLESALELYRRAGAEDARASMAFRGAGFALLELGRPEEAIFYLKDALRIDPTASRPWENLGLAYSAIYDAAARELFESSLQSPSGAVDPNDPVVKRMDALRARLAARDWRADALAAMREAVRLEPAEAKYWYNLGTSLKQYRPLETAEATSALLKALELDGTYYPALRNLALALLRQGRRREARDICLRMEKVSGSDDPAVASILGDIALDEGDLDEAERRFAKLLEIESDSVHAHMSLAMLFRRRGDLERSRVHTERAVALDPAHERIIRREIEEDR